MRNLSLRSSVGITIPGSGKPTVTTLDLDENVLYIASERKNADEDAEIEIYKSSLGQEDSEPTLVALFTSTWAPGSASQVIAFRVLAETHRLSVILRGGDIGMINLDDDVPTIEVEGTVEPGLSAASWGPDDSLLVLVTIEDKLILMTSMFDVLSEAPLNTVDFGEDAPINVGWGSKQTQFHGSAGKSAAQASPVFLVGSSPDDDTFSRISWRGDGAFFVVSSLSPPTHQNTLPRRALRIYDRQAALQSTSEAVAGLEHSLAWRPSGNIIVSTQRFGFEGGGAGRDGRHDVVFFERNGLRHGEFGIRVGDLGVEARLVGQTDNWWGYKVRDVSWSSDSNVLAVWVERDAGDVVQLWTTGNYHWYMKQEIAAPRTATSPGRFKHVSWHPEEPLTLTLTTSTEVIHRTYAWDTFRSRTTMPVDSGSVAVMDGACLLLTPFRTQNVPPPMFAHKLTFSPDDQPSAASRIPIHAAFSSQSDILVALWESGRVELWDLHTRLGPGREKVMAPSQTWCGVVEDITARQVFVGTKGQVVVLGSEKGGKDVAAVVDSGKTVHRISLPASNGRLLDSDEAVSWQAPDGEVFDVDSTNESFNPISLFPEFCFLSQRISSASSSTLLVGLGASGKLHVSNETGFTYTIATNATSFTIASGFVIITTSSHEGIFAPVVALGTLLADIAAADEDESETKKAVVIPEWERRRVERGSRIVTAVSSTMSLVLQMPRGNLETINPRPLVMEVVRQDLDAKNYRKAFFACRKHRIDLHVIVEHNPVAFLENLSIFIEQVEEVDHLNLFLASIGRWTQPPEVIANLCDSIRKDLEARDLTRYINTILTAFVVKTPPDHESGLAMLLRLRETKPSLVEEAVKYIIFLVDANRLFDTALGMYDFSLVLMIAQHAQKDPREYLPFLRELRALDGFYQRFRIDDHLQRHEKALKSLSLAGPERFDEAISYVEQHKLYIAALSTWKGTENYSSVLDIYGDWLFERREFKQAASVFIQAERHFKAMVAHEKALEWQELFDLAVLQQTDDEELIAMGYRVAEDLTSKKRFSEAASVLFDYAKDVREAVATLVQGNLFSEARRIASLNAASNLLVEVIHPGALESRSQMGEDIAEMRDQLRKQVSRLAELRIKKIEEPDAYYGEIDNPALNNVDVMTDAMSMPATAFTRYTIAPTNASKSSKRSGKTKRKMERKVGSGRKGTIDEEEYLLKSVTKLVTRFTGTQVEVAALLPHLTQFSEEHRTEGVELQQDLDNFEGEITAAVEEIWRPKDVPEGEDGWALRMEKIEKAKMVEAIERVVKPEFVSSSRNPWRMKLFEA